MNIKQTSEYQENTYIVPRQLDTFLLEGQGQIMLSQELNIHHHQTQDAWNNSAKLNNHGPICGISNKMPIGE